MSEEEVTIEPLAEPLAPAPPQPPQEQQTGEGVEQQAAEPEPEPVSVKKEPFCTNCHNIKIFEGGVWKCKNTMCPLYAP